MTTKLNATTRLLASKDEAEIKRLKNRNKKIKDDILKYKDQNTSGGHDTRLKDLRQQLKDNQEVLKKLGS